MITRILRKEEQWKSDRIQVYFKIPFDTEKAKKQSQDPSDGGSVPGYLQNEMLGALRTIE